MAIKNVVVNNPNLLVSMHAMSLVHVPHVLPLSLPPSTEMKRAELGLLEVLGLVVNAGRSSLATGPRFALPRESP